MTNLSDDQSASVPDRLIRTGALLTEIGTWMRDGEVPTLEVRECARQLFALADLLLLVADAADTTSQAKQDDTEAGA
ncbi:MULTISPECIES: hypothetical protein [unclassified Amycolatopsis]|uniref:hypothetical protein n=1 Tax=unclassified Amycolatopsis TaxID=2618356 RepID=UPI00106F0330|nr:MULTISPECIES: hypothetical protein [unclassified Amycolatopsis]